MLTLNFPIHPPYLLLLIREGGEFGREASPLLDIPEKERGIQGEGILKPDN
jgi:hypothetical protein